MDEIGLSLANSVDYLINRLTKLSIKDLRQSSFLAKFALIAKNSEAKREDFAKKGIHVPTFIISSITQSCNLSCPGCYARNVDNDVASQTNLTASQWEDVFNESSELGIPIMVIAGGEPFLRTEIIEIASIHKDMFFPVLTNGTLVNDKNLDIFMKNRNLALLFALDGNEEQTDKRRGNGVFATVMSAMQKARTKSILFGAAITVTHENVNTIISDEYLENLREAGCKVLIFIEHIPEGKQQSDFALAPEDRAVMREEIENLRAKYNSMVLIRFPGDEKKIGGCMSAARGYFRISADGNAEPCLFSPYSDRCLKTNTLLECINSPLFDKIHELGRTCEEFTGGCYLHMRENDIRKMVGLED